MYIYTYVHLHIGLGTRRPPNGGSEKGDPTKHHLTFIC